MNQAQTSSLSRRLGPLFAEIAAQASKPSMEQHKAEYRARPISERLNGVFAEQAALAARGGKPGLARALEMAAAQPSPTKAYKPTHGGYPG